MPDAFRATPKHSLILLKSLCHRSAVVPATLKARAGQCDHRCMDDGPALFPFLIFFLIVFLCFHIHMLTHMRFRLLR